MHSFNKCICGLMVSIGLSVSLQANFLTDVAEANRALEPYMNGQSADWEIPARLFINTFNNLNNRLHAHYQQYIEDGDGIEVPIAGYPIRNYLDKNIGPRGAVREDSAIWMGCWRDGKVLTQKQAWIFFDAMGARGFWHTTYFSGRQQGEVGACCSSDGCKMVCCTPLGWLTWLGCFCCCMCGDGVAYRRDNMEKKAENVIKSQFGRNSLYDCYVYLRESFCKKVGSLIQKVLTQEQQWTLEKFLCLLNLYNAYVCCDLGHSYQAAFAQEGFDKIRNLVHDWFLGLILNSENLEEGVNDFLVKQLLNALNNPYDEEEHGIGYYQIEIGLILEKLKEKVTLSGEIEVPERLAGALAIITKKVNERKVRLEEQMNARLQVRTAAEMGYAARRAVN